MSHSLMATIMILAFPAIGFILAWTIAVIDSRPFPYEKAIPGNGNRRNRAWDAAVNRARNRH